jgi:hypothetical protein
MRRSDRAWEDEFRAYVLRSRGSLLRTATLLAFGNAHEAEDLVQTVLMRMYVKWPRIPEGWFLQGSNPFSLTIAPQGDASSPDAFEGKLVVMLLSSSAPQKLPQGDPVKVGNHDGVIEHGEADVLTYEDGAGHFVQIEAWHEALGWTDEQLTSFAEGVRVTANAQAGVG